MKPVQEFLHAKNGPVHHAGTVKYFLQWKMDLLLTNISQKHFFGT